MWNEESNKMNTSTMVSMIMRVSCLSFLCLGVKIGGGFSYIMHLPSWEEHYIHAGESQTLAECLAHP